jgi:CHAT domain-containing protein/tetratricopeptide (TPR) repeat protein
MQFIDSLIDNGNYKQAINCLNVHITAIEKENGRLNEAFAKAYGRRNYLLLTSGGNINNVSSRYDTLLGIRRQVYGTNSLEVSNTLSDLSVTKALTGNISEAEKLLKMSIKIATSLLSDTSDEVIRSKINYAIILRYKRNCQASKRLLLELKEKMKRESYDANLKLYVLQNLAETYEELNDYSKQELTLIEAYEFIEYLLDNNLFPDRIITAKIINSLGAFYFSIKDFEKSQNYYSSSLNIASAFGVYNHDYQISLINLASSYANQGKIDSSMKLLSMNSQNNPKGRQDSLFFTDNLYQIGTNYSDKKAYDSAILYLIEAVALKKKMQLNESHTDFLHLYRSLGIVYENQCNYSMAKYYYKKALNIFDHFDHLAQIKHSKILYDYSIFCALSNDNEEAINFITRYNGLLIEKTNQYFYFLNEAEQFRLLSKIYNNQYIQKSLLSKFGIENRYTESIFEGEERIKGVIFNNNISIKRLTLNKKIDNATDSLYCLLTDAKNNLYYAITSNLQNEYIKDIENRIGQINKLLIAKTGYRASGNEITYEYIKSKLKHDQLYVEYSSYQLYDKNRWTDSIISCAYLISPNLKYPVMINLFNNHEIGNLYRSANTSMSTDLYSKNGKLFKLIWSPIEQYLRDVSTVYVNSSGLLNKISIGTISDSNGKSISEKYSFHNVRSVTEILDYAPTFLSKSTLKQAIIYGGIDYDKAKPKLTITSHEENIGYSEVAEVASRSAVAKFGYLPGAESEARKVKQLCSNNGITVTSFTGVEANEESFKRLSGRKEPYILHIATHGYFFPDPERKKEVSPRTQFMVEERKNAFKWSDDPLLRSGLIFAGANNVWGKTDYVSDSTEDGILTSYEISNLDLSSCQLVVLSACETGLGDIKGSEGVFGLQRAFKMAGVKNIIMSLWKIPDEQTSELMTSFYNYCFTGKSVHDALQAAQNEMKKKYPPYYWAGFKLLE